MALIKKMNIIIQMYLQGLKLHSLLMGIWTNIDITCGHDNYSSNCVTFILIHENDLSCLQEVKLEGLNRCL